MPKSNRAESEPQSVVCPRTIPLFVPCHFCGSPAKRVGDVRLACCVRHVDLVLSKDGKRVRWLGRPGEWYGSLQELEAVHEAQLERWLYDGTPPTRPRNPDGPPTPQSNEEEGGDK